MTSGWKILGSGTFWTILTAALTLFGVIIAFEQLKASKAQTRPPSVQSATRETPQPQSSTGAAPNVTATGENGTAVGVVNGDVAIN